MGGKLSLWGSKLLSTSSAQRRGQCTFCGTHNDNYSNCTDWTEARGRWRPIDRGGAVEPAGRRWGGGWSPAAREHSPALTSPQSLWALCKYVAYLEAGVC